jgi:hypothetical protein
METLERECHERFCWSPISVRQSMCVEIEISKPSAPKGQQNSAQGFNPGLLVLTRCALKVAPECDYPAHCYTRWTDCLPVRCLFQGTRPFNLEPRVKTLGLVLLPLRGRNPKASDGIIALSSMSSCRNIQLVSRRSFP